MALANKKRVLITGASGFMGSNFLRLLYNKYPGYDLTNLDILAYAGNQDNLLDIEEKDKKLPKNKRRYHFVKGDICDPVLIKKLFKTGFDVVVNFAADSHVDRSIMDARIFMHTNITGVNNLIHFVKEFKIPRFIQISTDEVYGDIDKGFSKEDHPFRPSNPYSASKASADLIMQSYMRTHKLPLLIVRGSNNFGPFQYPEKLIPLTITNILEGKKIPVHGDGSQIRKWIHVNDFCNAVDLVMHEAEDRSIYNISGIEMSNLQIIRAISSYLGKGKDEYVYFVQDRPGGDARYSPDSSKIGSELGWKIKYPVKHHLREVVQWYIDNEPWWRKIKNKGSFRAYYKKQLNSEY